jgi:hypothetical protein
VESFCFAANRRPQRHHSDRSSLSAITSDGIPGVGDHSFSPSTGHTISIGGRLSAPAEGTCLLDDLLVSRFFSKPQML